MIASITHQSSFELHCSSLWSVAPSNYYLCKWNKTSLTLGTVCKVFCFKYNDQPYLHRFSTHAATQSTKKQSEWRKNNRSPTPFLFLYIQVNQLDFPPHCRGSHVVWCQCLAYKSHMETSHWTTACLHIPNKHPPWLWLIISQGCCQHEGQKVKVIQKQKALVLFPSVLVTHWIHQLNGKEG